MTDHANELRRHARKIPHPQGETPGVMLRAADEIDRLRAENAGLVDDMNLLRDNNTSLRAKIAEMEQQEPVMWANSSNINSSRINKERGGSGDQHTCSETQTAYHHAQLYALPGARPAPSVQDVPAKSLKPVIDWLRNGCDPMKAADELEILIAAALEKSK